jgi:hypothetical protein
MMPAGHVTPPTDDIPDFDRAAGDTLITDYFEPEDPWLFHVLDPCVIVNVILTDDDRGLFCVLRMDGVTDYGQPRGEWGRMEYCLPWARHTPRDGWLPETEGKMPNTVRTAMRALRWSLGYRGKLNEDDFKPLTIAPNGYRRDTKGIFYTIDVECLTHEYDRWFNDRGNAAFRALCVDAQLLDLEYSRNISWRDHHRQAVHYYMEVNFSRDIDPLEDADMQDLRLVHIPLGGRAGRFHRAAVRGEIWASTDRLIAFELDDCTILQLRRPLYAVYPYVPGFAGCTTAEVKQLTAQEGSEPFTPTGW